MLSPSSTRVIVEVYFVLIISGRSAGGKPGLSLKGELKMQGMEIARNGKCKENASFCRVCKIRAFSVPCIFTARAAMLARF